MFGEPVYAHHIWTNHSGHRDQYCGGFCERDKLYGIYQAGLVFEIFLLFVVLMLVHICSYSLVFFHSFIRALTVFADLYNFLTVWRSSALTVHTELCSLVLTVNCSKTEKLLTVVQSCSSFWVTAKFSQVQFNESHLSYILRCSIWNYILIKNGIDTFVCTVFFF